MYHKLKLNYKKCYVFIQLKFEWLKYLIKTYKNATSVYNVSN